MSNNLFSILGKFLPETKALSNLPAVIPRRETNQIDVSFNELRTIGLNEITLYPEDNGERYISKGFSINDGVYSIVTKNAEKAGQIRLRHTRVKKNEQKTLREYHDLTKGPISHELMIELKRMRKSMIDEMVVKGDLSTLLNKPNRYQTQGEFIENLMGLREIQGEGNLWFNRGDSGKRILEMLPIPKPQLHLVGNGLDPFEIVAYEFELAGRRFRWNKEDVVMWKYTNIAPVSHTLEHLRGLAPLKAFMIGLQGMNEADKRIANSNANAGAAGFAFRKDAGLSQPTPEQAFSMRKQFNDIVNNNELAGKIAMLGGDWGYYNVGTSMGDQKILEQYNLNFIRLCRIFKTPSGIFNDDAKYANQPEYKRDWIYDKIAPNLYKLTDLINLPLLNAFNLSPETDLVDFDIMNLPELGKDLAKQVAAVKDASWLSVNEKRIATGYEPAEGEEYDFVPVNDGPIGEPLDTEEDLLNNQ